MAGKSVNKVILIGNLGKDPEVKYTPQGTPVAKLTLATNERFKDKAGEWQDRTEWHNVVLWQRLAEIAGEYLKKGGKVYIEGRLQTRSWDDKTSGQKKYMTEVVASDLVLLGGRGEGSEGGGARGASSSSSGGSGNNFDQRMPEPEPVGVGRRRSATKIFRSNCQTCFHRKRRRFKPGMCNASSGTNRFCRRVRSKVSVRRATPTGCIRKIIGVHSSP